MKRGVVFHKVYEEAAKWYRKTAAKNLAKAHNSLGNIYVTGKGVPLDYKQALKWYQSAVDLGDINALANIGRMYEKG